MRPINFLKLFAFATMVCHGFSTLNAQCLHPGLFPDYTGFSWVFDYNHDPSTFTIDGLICNECMWTSHEEENEIVCACRQECFEDREAFIASCEADCLLEDPGHYTACHASCVVDADDEFEDCIENCGEYIDGKVVSSWVLQTSIWYTTTYTTVNKMRAPDDYSYEIGYTTLPNKVKYNTTHNLYGVFINYCIDWEVRNNFADGSCCYFYDEDCVYRG